MTKTEQERMWEALSDDAVRDIRAYRALPEARQTGEAAMVIFERYGEEEINRANKVIDGSPEAAAKKKMAFHDAINKVVKEHSGKETFSAAMANVVEEHYDGGE